MMTKELGEPAGLRSSAIAWLKMRTADGAELITQDELDDFTYNGERFPLKPTMQGIRKPINFEAALSIHTVFRRDGAERPYEDTIGEDGLIRYKWQGDNPYISTNVGLRKAMSRRLPIIWFRGMSRSPARYQAVMPVFIVAEEPHLKQFVMAVVDYPEDVPDPEALSSVESVARKYFYRLAKARVHQPAFRSKVLLAYKNRCTVCSLAHPLLLDAAHIVADRDENGIASVVNGLAMCKIHHAAFDSYFLGVRPDHTVQIRHDLLKEVDGPMLRHGLQELHGKKLMVVPKGVHQRPRTDLLEEKYELFKNAMVSDVS